MDFDGGILNGEPHGFDPRRGGNPHTGHLNSVAPPDGRLVHGRGQGPTWTEASRTTGRAPLPRLQSRKHHLPAVPSLVSHATPRTVPMTTSCSPCRHTTQFKYRLKLQSRVVVGGNERLVRVSSNCIVQVPKGTRRVERGAVVYICLTPAKHLKQCHPNVAITFIAPPEHHTRHDGTETP